MEWHTTCSSASLSVAHYVRHQIKPPVKRVLFHLRNGWLCRSLQANDASPTSSQHNYQITFEGSKTTAHPAPTRRLAKPSGNTQRTRLVSYQQASRSNFFLLGILANTRQGSSCTDTKCTILSQLKDKLLVAYTGWKLTALSCWPHKGHQKCITEDTKGKFCSVKNISSNQQTPTEINVRSPAKYCTADQTRWVGYVACTGENKSTQGSGGKEWRKPLGTLAKGNVQHR